MPQPFISFLVAVGGGVFIFLATSQVMRDLISQTGMKHYPPAVEAQIKHWTVKEIPDQIFLFFFPPINYFLSSCLTQIKGASLVAQMVKNLCTMQETQVQPLGWEDPLEKEMATHASILSWRTPWTEEPDRVQSMGLQRVRHD